MMRALFLAAALGVLAPGLFGCGNDSASAPRSGATALRIAGLVYVPVETLTVPVDSSAVTSATVLETGKNYRLMAWGTFTIGGPGDGQGDAEYSNFAEPPASLQDHCGGVSSGVDLGIAIDDAPVDSLKSPHWGDFDPSHVYALDVVGAGTALTFTYHDCDYTDNSGSLRVAILSPVLEVVVDVKPGSDVNPINPGSRGVIPLAVLGAEDFDVSVIDVASLAFGPGGAHEAHGKGHYGDVNGDGFMDLVAHFRTQEVGVEAGDTELCLEGTTLDGTPLLGCSPIRTVPPDHDGD